MENNNDYQVKLVINHEAVALNQFTHDVVKNVILSLVTSLRLKSKPEIIEITISQSQKPADRK